MTSRRPVPFILAFIVSGPTLGHAQQRVELPGRDRAPGGKPAPVWAVGTDEGESWEMFANVSQLVFDGNDNLYVLDQGNSRVVVFDAGGRFVRQFGKQGGGPGEFQSPAAISIDPDGSIVVFDMARRGYSVFEPNGTYREHIPLPQEFGLPRANEIAAHPDGGVVVRAMPVISPEAGVPDDSLQSPIYHQLLDRETPVSQLHRFMMPPPRVMTPPSSGGRQIRMVAFARPTFAVEPSWGVLPDGGLAISQDDDWVIRVTDSGGTVERLLTRPLRGRAVSRRDQEAARDRRREELARSGGPGARVVSRGAGGTFVVGSGAGQPLTDAQIEEQVRNMQFAETMPAIRRIVVDATGRLWVERNPERVGDDAPIDLIGPGDRYIGTLTGQTIPRAVSPSGLAAWVEKNDLDVEQIVVRRLPTEWR